MTKTYWSAGQLVVVFSALGAAACVVDSDDDQGSGGAASAPGGQSVGIGGGPPAGGAPTGGAEVTGGAPPSGGALTGGVAPGDGGAATGGVAPTGGVQSTGGAAPTGGSDACASGPLATSVPSCAPAAFTPTGDYHQDCVDRINQFRAECQCLPPLARWTEAEACADQMAAYDAAANSAHAAFRAELCEPGGTAQNECPGWDSAESILVDQRFFESCIGMMWHEVDDPSGEQGHYEALSSTRYTRVACGIYDDGSGNVWALQNYGR